ncbi:NADH-quinone oxidoreductase subunit NuoN [Rickettsiella grylli]|uniref:NADH-quinone oxidoreductase subunit N n=1 Tax=Rickettsiella grylli TaxID=59196 RepID=A8PM97_9COXI|nr:NADH-quinone oxidoreductase subunit NuoN [Rickettsiella grylli]EDP46738.1 NADH dehydrogenase i, n subunit [Rickettsiella grylli]
MMTLQQYLLYPALPEIALLLMTCVILFIDLFAKQKNNRLTYSATQLSLLITLALLIHLYHVPAQLLFHAHFTWDLVAYFIKLCILIFSLFAFVYARDALKNLSIHSGEYYLLGLFSILGMLVLTSANSLLTLYLGLELLSFPLYAMVALRRQSSQGAEAAIKYFILGALASGLFLYGLSLLYGASHSLILSSIHDVLVIGGQSPLLLSTILIFILAGIAFKVGAAPFQLWVPDVYQGAPTPVTLFISAGPKIAGLALAIRILVGTMPSLLSYWQPLIAVIAILSFSLGNLVAIVQSNLKRMLAYSSVAHMGYGLLGLVAGTKMGYAMSIFYMLAYGLMALAAFGLLVVMSRFTQIEDINDLKGLNARSPWLALMMLITMFSMAGIPPTIGFFAKLGILEALISVHLLWIATLAIIFAIIGAYYYINVVKVMYFEEPEPTVPQLSVASDAYLALSINAILLLILGLFPSQLIWLAKTIFFTINHPVY